MNKVCYLGENGVIDEEYIIFFDLNEDPFEIG